MMKRIALVSIVCFVFTLMACSMEPGQDDPGLCPGSGALPGPDCDGEDLPRTMIFECADGMIMLDVKFSVSRTIQLQGFMNAPSLTDVKSIRFFMDQHDIAESPSAELDLSTLSAVLEIPGNHVTGNLFLELHDGSYVWANLGDTGSWEITDAERNENGMLVVSCERYENPTEEADLRLQPDPQLSGTSAYSIFYNSGGHCGLSREAGEVHSGGYLSASFSSTTTGLLTFNELTEHEQSILKLKIVNSDNTIPENVFLGIEVVHFDSLSGSYEGSCEEITGVSHIDFTGKDMSVRDEALANGYLHIDVSDLTRGAERFQVALRSYGVYGAYSYESAELVLSN